jgi:DNA-binding GntR family transcriptional regulator
MHKLTVDLLYYFFDNVKPSPAMVKKTLEDHGEMIELLAGKKYEAAAELCSRHIREVSKKIGEKSKEQSLLRIQREAPETSTKEEKQGETP